MALGSRLIALEIRRRKASILLLNKGGITAIFPKEQRSMAMLVPEGKPTVDWIGQRKIAVNLQKGQRTIILFVLLDKGG
jgi:hypothetical protein